MIAYAKFAAAALIAAFLLAGCISGPPPETYNERMAAVEIGWQEGLRKVQVWRSEGRLTPDALSQIRATIRDYQAAREAVMTAESFDLRELHLDTMSGKVALLRSLLEELE